MRPVVVLLAWLAAFAAGAQLAGCAHVEAWEKGDLAQPSMRLDADALDARFMQHVYTSREAASGGGSVGGGGCGCN